jgi:hypothetical protein
MTDEIGKLTDFLQIGLAGKESYKLSRRLVPPDNIFSIERLRQLLNNPLLSPEWLQVSLQGKPVDLTSDHLWKLVQKRQLRFLDKTRLLEALNAKASLVLEGLDILDPGLFDLAEKLDAELPCGLVHCDAFWSRGGGQGNEAYGGHRDSDDVLVIQISGSKKWRIHSPQQRRYIGNSPLTEEQMGPLQLETILMPGDVLYVRAGTPHRCTTPEDHSLHLSFDLNDRTPNIDQITNAANSLYKQALSDCHAPAELVVTNYARLLGSSEFQGSLRQATSEFREEAKQFRKRIRGSHNRWK